MDQPYSYSAVYPNMQQPCRQQQASGFYALPQLSQAIPGNPPINTGFPTTGVSSNEPYQTQDSSGNGSSNKESAMPQQLAQPITDMNQPMPITVESLQYLNGFLRTQIGRKVRVEFLIGANTLNDRIGTLVGVGANYILLNEIDTDDILACDFYNIKFIRFYY